VERASIIAAIEAKEVVMRCIHCQGRMKKSIAPFHIDRRGYHLSLDKVPAWVCSQCGEPYFEEREVKTIQQLLLQIDKRAANLASVA
jgi:YgiT-type zinc finger domain-containing protein